MDINFETGIIELAVQGDPDRILRFNPANETFVRGFLDMVETSKTKLYSYADKESKICGSTIDSIDKLRKKNELNLEIDKYLRGELDRIMGAGTSDIVFGNMCVTAITQSGQTVFLNFINALLGVIQKENQNRNKKVNDLIKKYKPQR